jgi:glycosyltransferase involved in cell wall biosynthesis
LRSRIGHPSQYAVIRSGIEVDRFGHPTVSPAAMRAQLGLGPDTPILGSVTRLVPQKSPLDLVRMFAHVAAHIPDAVLVIVGDGPLRPEIEVMVRQLELNERVRLLGLRRDVPELIACFDLFVLTSLWEGLPRVLPQALASAIPVVATRVDGNAEIVQHGVNGYLCPEGQPEQMAAHCIELLQDPSLRRAMGEKALQAVAGFSSQEMVSQIELLYRELMAQQQIKARQSTLFEV